MPATLGCSLALPILVRPRSCRVNCGRSSRSSSARMSRSCSSASPTSSQRSRRRGPNSNRQSARCVGASSTASSTTRRSWIGRAEDHACVQVRDDDAQQVDHVVAAKELKFFVTGGLIGLRRAHPVTLRNSSAAFPDAAPSRAGRQCRHELDDKSRHDDREPLDVACWHVEEAARVESVEQVPSASAQVANDEPHNCPRWPPRPAGCTPRRVLSPD